MRKIYNSIDELIGSTPMLKLSRLCNELAVQANIYAKLERFNPTGSVKDRAALYMINDAEVQGRLTAGGTVIEPTSGNTGIGLAAICASRGYRCVIVMPDNMSKERRALIAAYGAELVLTDASLGMKGAIARAEELASNTPNAIIAGQFTNPANVMAHYETTGREICESLDGNVDVFVAGVGTGGTLTGTARYLKEKNKNCCVVAVEPGNSAVLSGGKAGSHGLQGIGAGFVTDLTDMSLIDEVLTVSEDEAYTAARELASREGVLVGISSGAALSAAIKVASKKDMEGKNIAVILADTGERYLSTELFLT